MLGIFVLNQKGIAPSIPKDPIDSATVKLHNVHKTFLLKIPKCQQTQICHTHKMYLFEDMV